MPTPDREALDARLRAVERALTDPDESPDPPGDTGEPSRSTDDGLPPSAADGPPSSAAGPPSSPGDERTDEPQPEGSAERPTDAPSRRALERRLLDLEAAVQALRGSLSGVDAERPRCPECGAERDLEPGDRPSNGASASAVTPPDRDRHPPAAPGRWPDDLAGGGHDGDDGEEGG